jgi:Mn-dependent DtxR family transcriptional regulator
MSDGPRQEPTLTEALVDLLADVRAPQTTMALALELRVAYPRVQSELESLEQLGIVIREDRGRAALWRLG